MNTSRKFYISIFLVIFILHCNSIKISVVKISEIFLLFFGIINFQSFTKISKRILSVFTLFLIVTLCHNLFLHFDESVVYSPLQAPYICSVSRYIELFCCVTFIEFCNSLFNKYGYAIVIDKIFKFNYYFNMFILIFFILEMYGGLSIFKLISQGYRLQGFFDEGGPFGLFSAMMLIISLKYKRSKKEIIILSLCLISSFSKAGTLFIAIGMVILFWYKSTISIKYRTLLILCVVPALFILFYISYSLVKNYGRTWIDTQETELYATNNEHDYSFVAGRIAGKYIGFEMIKQHPLIGIGLGNYPILRNNDEYRGFFPKIPIYDATGLGGIFEILIQGGIMTLLLFIRVLMSAYKCSTTKIFILYFIVCFICGVQLTFVYPWLLIALSRINYSNKQLVSPCNSPSIAVS